MGIGYGARGYVGAVAAVGIGSAASGDVCARVAARVGEGASCTVGAPVAASIGGGSGCRVAAAAEAGAAGVCVGSAGKVGRAAGRTRPRSSLGFTAIGATAANELRLSPHTEREA